MILHRTLAACFVCATLVPLFGQRAKITLPETDKPVIVSFHPVQGRQDAASSFDMLIDGKRTHITPRRPVVSIPKDKQQQAENSLWPTLSGAKLDASRFFFQSTYQANGNAHTLLIFVSNGGASDAAPSLVLGFTANILPYKILDKNQFDLIAIEQKDDGALIIGKGSLSQVTACLDYNPASSPYATTYDPFSVYVVTGGKPATYSLAQSRQYNLDHYIWAGPKSSENYLVVYNLPGHRKPFGATAKRAEAMLPHCKEAAK